MFWTSTFPLVRVAKKFDKAQYFNLAGQPKSLTKAEVRDPFQAADFSKTLTRPKKFDKVQGFNLAIPLTTPFPSKAVDGGVGAHSGPV